MSMALYTVSRHSAEDRDRDAEPAREEEPRAGTEHRVPRHHTDRRAKHQQQQRGDSQLALRTPDITRKASGINV